MNLREEILKEHSKKQRDKIVQWIGNDTGRFNMLLDLFTEGEYRVTQRAAWPLSYCVIAQPGLMQNNLEKLLKNLEKPNLHAAVKWNTVRLLQEIDLPEKYDGMVMEICFSYVKSAREAVAIKAFTLTILQKPAKKYPEIIKEVKILIEDQLPQQTAAFRQRAGRFLKTFPLN